MGSSALGTRTGADDDEAPDADAAAEFGFGGRS
jgi:hypothetical protein